MKSEGKRRKQLWRHARTARRGGAVVEMAVVSPLLLMMLLGMIEFGYVFMMQQSMTNAVREATRVATLPGATDADIQNRLVGALAPTGLNVTPGMIQITRATIQNPVVSVRLQVPYSRVTLLGVLPSSLFCGFFNGGQGGGGSIDTKTVGSTCSMHLEVAS
ncbi:MAG TPA: TadE/TadG family type IV pilus assembly protein [Phycisphaerae bacterium]|nr:TadE/TadG family type IV pilus assembly protein [Phycisphaerae bacterium]